MDLDERMKRFEERMEKLKEKEQKKADDEAEKLRQGYLDRTGRTEMEP
jgi:hypothetical protein